MYLLYLGYDRIIFSVKQLFDNGDRNIDHVNLKCFPQFNQNGMYEGRGDQKVRGKVL